MFIIFLYIHLLILLLCNMNYTLIIYRLKVGKGNKRLSMDIRLLLI